MLSHDEQLDRLAAAAPAAVPVATVVGDPCYDRLVGSIDQRSRYRDALGTGSRKLVMVSSTWSSGSLLGSWPDLIRRLLAELPIDSFQVVAALHPNTWHGHGPWQVRCWLADSLRSGLTLLPEIDGWRTGLIAADVLIGDHGSVTGYAAAMGVPTLLGAFADDDIAPGSPIAALGDVALRLDHAVSLRRQIDTAIRQHNPSTHVKIAELVTSAPGEALQRLRSVCYDLLALSEPKNEVPLMPVPIAPVPTQDRPPSLLAFQAEHTVDTETCTVRLVRHPAELASCRGVLAASDEQADTHLCCPVNYPLRTIRRNAAVLICRRADLPERSDEWSRSIFGHHPSCQAVAVLDGQSCVIQIRQGTRVRLHARDVPPDVQASAAYAWFSSTDTSAVLPLWIRVELDGKPHRVTLEKAEDSDFAA